MCADEGWGKIADTPTIVEAVIARLSQSESLKGVRVLITAGPTYEPIDPVRFIGNRSSGKMGYAVAEAGQPRVDAPTRAQSRYSGHCRPTQRRADCGGLRGGDRQGAGTRP